MEQYNWDDLDTMTVNDSNDIFTNTLTRSLNEHVPLKTATIPHRNIKHDPWVTTKIMKLSKNARNCIIKVYLNL